MIDRGAGMKMKTLSFALGLWAVIAAGMAAAQGYPTKPVKIIVGYPPAVPVDTVARVIAARLTETLGQPVLVENKPGAGSSIGAAAVAKSPPDGYTLYLSSSANSVNASLYKLSFDFLTDLAPISLVAEVPGILAVHPSAPSTLNELIAQAKMKPGYFSYGSSGRGTATHLYGELFALETGTKLTHVPYKGSSQTVVDLLSGRIHMMFSPAGTVMPHVKAGKLVALAIIGRERMAPLPDVATFNEAGIPGLESAFWFGLHAPRGTPEPIIERLNREVVRLLALPEVKSQLVTQTIFPVSSTSKRFDAFIRQDVEKWARVIKSAGVTVE
jgi:tripartite-type tricarboxylate transporter receptor subunit TctC